MIFKQEKLKAKNHLKYLLKSDFKTLGFPSPGITSVFFVIKFISLGGRYE